MELLSAALLFLCLLILLYFYGIKNHGYWKKQGVCYEKPLPFVGNLLDLVLMRRNQGEIVAQIYRKYPKERVVGVWNFDAPSLLVRDPDLINQVLVTDFYKFPHNEIEVDPAVDPVLASNIFCQRGQKWKRSRQVLTPAFTVGKVKNTYAKILDVNNQLIDYIAKHRDQINLKDLMSLYTSEIVAHWGLGIDGHSFTSENPILAKMGKAVFQPSVTNAISTNLIFLTPLIAKIFRLKLVPDDIHYFFRDMIGEMLEHRKKTGETQADFLQHFIEVQAKQAAKQENVINDKDILAGVVSFFMEGYETTSMVASFLLYHLAMNPDLQEEVRAEINSVSDFNFDDLEKFTLLLKCYQETNRMHAALGTMSKVCTERTLLGNVEVQPGTTVLIPALAIHWDPDYYPEPQKFDPHRFDDGIPKRNGTYIPFGDGPRICIGMRLASITVRTAMVHILKKFKIVPSAGTPSRFEQNPLHFMSNQKGGIYAKFVKL